MTTSRTVRRAWSRGSRGRAYAILSACALSTLSTLTTFCREAIAFDFPEHAHISHRALALAAIECDSTTDALCQPAKQLTSALRRELHGELLCTDDKADTDQPEGCFTLGDIPALAGDHAASPLLTLWRWLDPTVPSRKQAGLVVDLPGVVSMLDTSRRSPETELVRAPDRLGFLAYMRAYSPAKWPRKTAPSDMDLEGFDDSYIGLAERGHPHFRPRLSPPSRELASERRPLFRYPKDPPRTRTRSKPRDQAFAWYADQHLGALRMAHAASLSAAGGDRELLLAVATFLELNAWHYLEDSVAAGHMVADAQDLNNGALTATHNEYCAGGTDPTLPPRVVMAAPEKVCSIVSASGWGGGLAELADACRVPTRPQRLLGDHMLVKACTGRPGEACEVGAASHDANVTEQWAVALTAESFREVVRASLGESFGALPANDRLLTCASQRTTDTAYTWPTNSGEVAFYECLFAWWEEDPGREHEKGVAALYDADAFRALRSVPVPAAVPADAERTYPEETFFSGNAASIAPFGYAYTWSLRSKGDVAARAGADFQYLLAVPRTLAPLIVTLGGGYETGFGDASAPRVSLHVGGRYYFSELSKWYAGGAFEVGHLVERKAWSVGGDAIPVGVTWLDRPHAMSTFEVRMGGDGVFGWRAGLGASVAF